MAVLWLHDPMVQGPPEDDGAAFLAAAARPEGLGGDTDGWKGFAALGFADGS